MDDAMKLWNDHSWISGLTKNENNDCSRSRL